MPTLRINGLDWPFEWRTRRTLAKGVYGQCTPPTAKSGPLIECRRDQCDRSVLETVIHECLHAEQWEMFDEAYVTRVAHELAAAIHKLGWRRTDGET